MFPVETFKAISEMASASIKPFDLGIADPRVKRFLVDGKRLDVELPTPPVAHSAGSLDDLINLANAAPDGEVTVWYNKSRVTVVVDRDGHADDRTTFQLLESKVFATVRGLESAPKQFDQRSFVRLLAIDLHCAIRSEALLPMVRSMKFTSGEAVSSTISPKRESLGSHVHAIAETASKANIPEEIVLDVPIYVNYGERTAYPILCSLEVMPVEQRFVLCPIHDQITNAYDLAMENIGSRLKAGLVDGIPCYMGDH